MPVVPRIDRPPTMPSRPLSVFAASASPPGIEISTSTSTARAGRGGDFGDGVGDDAAGHRIDRGLARRHWEAGARDGADAFAGTECHAGARRTDANGRANECAVGHVGIVAGVLDHPGRRGALVFARHGERKARPFAARQCHFDRVRKLAGNSAANAAFAAAAAQVPVVQPRRNGATCLDITLPSRQALVPSGAGVTMGPPHDGVGALAAGRAGIPVFEPGHVWLAGAGPGDPGLLTLDALAGLTQADVVVHDALVDQRILALAGSQARLEFAGKRGGKPSAVQADISERLVALARASQRVLRLKGGDPFVFGRGGEEAMTLAAAGIPFRIIPGVTAGLAALAAAAIPATLRGINRAVIFAAGHGAEEDFDWAPLARAGQPIVLYMVMHNLDRIAAALMDGGTCRHHAGGGDRLGDHAAAARVGVDIGKSPAKRANKNSSRRPSS